MRHPFFKQIITGVSILYVFFSSVLWGRIWICQLWAQVLSEKNKKKKSVHVKIQGRTIRCSLFYTDAFGTSVSPSTGLYNLTGNAEKVNTVWQKHTSPPRREIDFVLSWKPDRENAVAEDFFSRCVSSLLSWQHHGSGGGQRRRQLVTALWTQISSGCERSPEWASAAGKHPGCKMHCWMPERKEDS